MYNKINKTKLYFKVCDVMECFLKKFNISTSNNCISKYFETAKNLLLANGNDIMEFERYSIFTYMKQDIARIRNELIKDTDNVLYAYLLYVAIKNADTFAISVLSSPQNALDDEKFDTLPLFSLLYMIPNMVSALRQKGVPEDVIEATLNMFENQMQDFFNLHQHYGISCYVSWMMKFIRCEIIKVGRFNLEMCDYTEDFDVFQSGDRLAVLPNGVTFHKSGQILGSVGFEDEKGSFLGEISETDDFFEGILIENGLAKNQKTRLDKALWKKILTKGDRIISYHIPSGDKLDYEENSRDIERGKKIIAKSFGEVKCGFCLSWLLDPQIKEIVGKPTNLTAFADRFLRFPIKSSGEDVFDYVFLCPSSTPLEELPEKSSFAKAIKNHLIGGGHIYGAGGVML